MLYGEKAGLYDRIYHWKDYAADAGRIREVLNEAGIPDGSRVLETACGTGNFLVPLSRWFRMEGSDLSPEMLAIAKGKAPEVPLSRADFADFAVAEPFDAVLCLFSSIGYARPDERLRAAATSFARAVRPGGAVVIEPWVFPETFRDGMPHLQTYEDEKLKLCRANVSRVEGRDAILDFHWLAARAGEGVEHFTERHVLRIYSRSEYEAALDEAGFDVRFVEGGRGIFVGVRRGPPLS